MTEGAGSASALVAVGRVRRSHGVRGVVVVEYLTHSPDEIFIPGRRLFGEPPRARAGSPSETLHIEWAEPFQGGLRVQFTEVQDRPAADLWRNRQLLLPETEMPEPEEGEILLEDLVGLAVVRENGDAVGTVTSYYELPHDLLVEVTRQGGGTVLIPYREEFVTDVDLEQRRLVVEPPEGLL